MAEKQYSILLVDDERDSIDALYNSFVDKYEVYKTNGTAEALGILKEKHIDLIISDQRMPETTGVGLFTDVEKSPPDIGRVLLTGYSDLQTAVNAINKGPIDRYITKPWVEDDIVHIVLEVMNVRLKQAIEERKRLESQLIQSAKMASLGEMVAGIAHELNNPLGFIYANLGNLKKFYKKIMGLLESYDRVDFPGETKKEIEKRKKEINYDYIKGRIRDMIERSSVGADRMKKIIQDLKSFSRLDAAEFADADINEAIETTLSIMFHEYKNRIEIKREFGSIPPVKCYISKLNQVFMNLLVNACHAIAENGEISIKTGSENGKIKIEISDTGSGIPESAMDKIFDPFFTTKAVGKGTGLGLSISHKIIKQHKGEISVKSNPGENTTFTIKIPMHLENEDLDT